MILLYKDTRSIKYVADDDCGPFAFIHLLFHELIELQMSASSGDIEGLIGTNLTIGC